jgi:hypothetical protein
VITALEFCPTIARNGPWPYSAPARAAVRRYRVTTGPVAGDGEGLEVSSHPVLRDADWWDIDHLAGMGAAATVNTAVGSWLVRDPLRRGLHLQQHFRHLITATLLAGTVRVVEEDGRVLGATLSRYCRPGAPAPGPWATGYDAASSSSADPEFDHRLDLLAQAFARSHPQEQHDCLILTAIAPSLAAEGVTSSLLDDHLLRRVGIASYTLAMDAPSAQLYRRHHFAHAGSPTWLPDGPPVWPMTYLPRPETAR